MYSYEDRIRAVKLYIKLGKRTAATIRQLGYSANTIGTELPGPAMCGHWFPRHGRTNERRLRAVKLPVTYVSQSSTQTVSPMVRPPFSLTRIALRRDMRR
jgi:hypothetical protein